MESTKFTWFPKLTATVERVPEEQRPALLWALARYGTYGIEPDLEWPLDAVFEALREDIDNSKRAIRDGATGGRGNKKAASDSSETPLSESEKAPSETNETQVSETEKGGFENAEANTYHSIPNHTKPVKEKGSARFKPPTVDEIAGYAEEYAAKKRIDLSRIDFDPERFHDFYAAKAWKVGRAPMKDWRAAVRNWIRDSKPKKGGGDYARYDR